MYNNLAEIIMSQNKYKDDIKISCGYDIISDAINTARPLVVNGVEGEAIMDIWKIATTIMDTLTPIKQILRGALVLHE